MRLSIQEEARENVFSGVAWRHGGGVDSDLRMNRSFLGAVDAGEVLNFTVKGFLLEPLGVALLGNCQRRVDIDFNEFAFVKQRTLRLER